MLLFEVKTTIPLDVVRYIDTFCYLKINNNTIRDAVDL